MLFDLSKTIHASIHINFTDEVVPLALNPCKLGNAVIFKVTQTAPVLSALVDMYVFSVLTDNGKTCNPEKIKEAMLSKRSVEVHFVSHDYLCKLIQQYKKKERHRQNDDLLTLLGE